MASYADKPHILEKVNISTNQGKKVYYISNAFWKCSASVNLPKAVNKTNYFGINRFEARCCVYTVGLSILCENIILGNDFTDFPESFTRRKP